MDTFSIEKKKYEPTSKHVKAVDKHTIGSLHKVTTSVLGIFLGAGVNRWS